MPIRTIATLAVAILLGIGAVLLAQTWLGRQRATDIKTAQIAGTTDVVVAAQPLARGVALQPSLLKVVRFPQGSVPPGSVNSIAQLTEGGQRLALRPIAANEPILMDKITTPGGKMNMSAALTPGMRAVTFRSSEVAGVAGFVLPGDRVDVHLTREIDEMHITQVLMQAIKILAVDQFSDDASDKPLVANAITVEVTPDQAQAIQLAQSMGGVSLALRQIADEAPVARRVMTGAEFGYFRAPARPAAAAAAAPGAAPGAAVPAPPAPPPSGRPIRVTRGTDTKTYYVER